MVGFTAAIAAAEVVVKRMVGGGGHGSAFVFGHIFLGFFYYATDSFRVCCAFKGIGPIESIIADVGGAFGGLEGPEVGGGGGRILVEHNRFIKQKKDGKYNTSSY